MSVEPKVPTKPFAPRFKNLPDDLAAGPVASPAVPGLNDGATSGKFAASKRRTYLFRDLVKKDGTHKALSYAYLVAIDYDQKTITLEFTGYRVYLVGRTLDDVFRRLLAQAIGLIQEVDAMTDKATGDPKKPAVYSIKWEKV